jgi:hypothetical protein
VAEPSGSVVPVWERMTGERAGAFEAADIYFKLRSARSLAAVAAKTGKGLSQIEKWSVQRNWVDRATAYDDHLAEIANRAIEKQVSETAAKWSRRAEEQAEEEYQLGKQLDSKIEKMLTLPVGTVTSKDGKTIINPANWTHGHMLSMIHTATKLKREAIRKAIGEVDERVKENWDFGEFK